jgi:DNA adenine methylase
VQLSLFNPPPDQIINVSMVNHRSPFRYPGGKTWLIPRIFQWLGFREKKPTELIEPFAGGAIVGLTTAFEKLADHVKPGRIR